MQTPRSTAIIIITTTNTDIPKHHTRWGSYPVKEEAETIPCLAVRLPSTIGSAQVHANTNLSLTGRDVHTCFRVIG
jgi:hypothetical protein